LKLFFAILIAATTALPVKAADDTFQGASIKKPYDASTGKGGGTGSTQILYHGGLVMNQSNSVYVIYYGTFPSTTQPIINNFLSGLSGSAPYGVNTSYNQGAGTPSIPPSYRFRLPTASPGPKPSGSVYWDNYSQGSQLHGGSIPQIVTHAISAGLPPDQNAVYLVVTSPDVKISGFCNSFCAYHTSTAMVYNNVSLHIRYALIPDPTQRCSGCNGGIAVYGDTVTPNGDMGADTMTDDIMHELSETVTDPDITAWYTQSGAENGDLCNYVYGTAQIGFDATGAQYHYNVMLGGKPYLVQLIWKNAGTGYCAAQ
jgi:hypothetical protein